MVGYFRSLALSLHKRSGFPVKRPPGQRAVVGPATKTRHRRALAYDFQSSDAAEVLQLS
jgi:hypothetical protein